MIDARIPRAWCRSPSAGGCPARLSASRAARRRRCCRPGSRGRRPGGPAARAARTAGPSRAPAQRGALPGARRRASSASLTSRCRRRAGDVELDHVAVAHQRQRPAGGRFGRDVQHDGAVGGAAHARVGDAHHVGDALAQQLRRQRHVADLGHAGIAAAGRSSSAPSRSVSSMSSASSSMRAWKSSMSSNTTARPRCCIRCGDAADGLITAPSGARLPRSTAMPAVWLERLRRRRGSPRGCSRARRRCSRPACGR